MLSGIRQASSRQLMNARSATIAIGAQRRWLLIKNVDDVRKAGNIKMIGENVCESRRYLLRKDGFGFSLHYTILFKVAIECLFSWIAAAWHTNQQLIVKCKKATSIGRANVYQVRQPLGSSHRSERERPYPVSKQQIGHEWRKVSAAVEGK